jgi:hypothetical protein
MGLRFTCRSVLCRVPQYLIGTRHAAACGSETLRREVIRALLLLKGSRHVVAYGNVIYM